jgi:hypothetical protein
MEVETIDDPSRLSPRWGYIRPALLGVIVNEAHEPNKSALASEIWPNSAG